MTITDSISGQTGIGTGTYIGYGKFPTKITAQTDTSGFIVSAKLTNGAAAYHQNGVVRVFATSSNFSTTAALAPQQLRQQAVSFDVRPEPSSGLIAINKSELQVLTGGYIYFWLELPKVATSQTLDVSVIEI